MIDQEKLLNLLLYAVNEANGWYGEHNGGGIKSPEMAQCVAVLAANGLHPRDHDDGRAFLAGPPKDEQINDVLTMLGMEKFLDGVLKYWGPNTTIRTGLPGNWRKMYPEVKDGQ